jgi:hypothetical protein
MAEVKWLVTMTTYWCETVEDWASILVYKDGSVRCSHFNAYGPMIVKRRGSTKETVCEGPTCKLATDYREGVFRREEEEQRLGQKVA